MESVAFCSHCGKIIRRNYHICPWCGIATDREQAEEGFSEVVDKSFREIRRHQLNRDYDTLDRLFHRLDSLEEEITTFLATRK